MLRLTAYELYGPHEINQEEIARKIREYVAVWALGSDSETNVLNNDHNRILSLPLNKHVNEQIRNKILKSLK